ncbi:MAG: DHH family phosphoesterase [Acidobacteriaceae bacterium]
MSADADPALAEVSRFRQRDQLGEDAAIGPANAAIQYQIPQKRLMERPCNASVRDAYRKAGVAAAVADFLARRLDRFVEWESMVSPKLSQVSDPGTIPTMGRAVERIVRAIVQGERIALACDHDMDGTASAAVLWTSLVEFFGVPLERLFVVTSHRLTEGYGIGDAVAARIENFGAQLVISADKGSSDEPRIASLAAKGIDVIVTDHHVIPPEGPPQSAYAVVNPSRDDSDYDRHVCGAGVAFLVMAKVRSALLKQEIFPRIAPLTALLDYVAVATIADCVSLSPGASFTNRAFIRRGLEQLRSVNRPCWRIFAREQQGELDAEAIAFRMVPVIAAAGRLDWAEAGFRFLIAKTEADAATCWTELKRENAERQAIERRLRHQVFPQAARIDAPAIVLFLEDGHSGVHGITASRVVEAFGKPCAIFAPKGNGARSVASAAASEFASGSFRSVPGIDVQLALQRVASTCPGLMIAYGGHHAAAGATIRIEHVDRFRDAFLDAVQQQDDGTTVSGPSIFTDGELEAASHTLESVHAFDAIGPFGRGFEPPIYSGTFRVVTFRSLSDGRHGKFCLQRGDLVLPAIWFSIDSALEREPSPGDLLTIAYRLTRQTYRDHMNLQAVVVAGAFS